MPLTILKFGELKNSDQKTNSFRIITFKYTSTYLIPQIFEYTTQHAEAGFEENVKNQKNNIFKNLKNDTFKTFKNNILKNLKNDIFRNLKNNIFEIFKNVISLTFYLDKSAFSEDLFLKNLQKTLTDTYILTYFLLLLDLSSLIDSSLK